MSVVAGYARCPECGAEVAMPCTVTPTGLTVDARCFRAVLVAHVRLNPDLHPRFRNLVPDEERG